MVFDKNFGNHSKGYKLPINLFNQYNRCKYMRNMDKYRGIKWDEQKPMKQAQIALDIIL